MRSTIRWLSFGVPNVLLNLLVCALLVMAFPDGSAASEFWNIAKPKPDFSNQASAEVLQAIITGLEAFKDAEVGGVQARKAKLSTASGQLFDAWKNMTGVAAKVGSDPISLTPVSFDDLSADASTAVTNWLSAFDEKKPETWGDFYQLGVNSTEKLAEKYADFAKRDDQGVFRDFLSVTYPYLPAGAVASDVFSSGIE